LKKDIAEAKKGMECGLSLLKYDGDYKPGDVLQSYDTITKPAVL
jgi:translation initiation factor IF-2